MSVRSRSPMTYGSSGWQRTRTRRSSVKRPQGVCGMVTIVREPQQDSLGWLVGMWVAPSERGTGAADALIDAALAWAEHEQVGVVRLLVTEDNDRAASVYRRHSFRENGGSVVRGTDGTTEVVMERVLTH